MTHGITTISISGIFATLRIITLSIMTLSTTVLSVPMLILNTLNSYAEWYYTDFHIA
jgi:hypothetical protein